tara:strand:+ start:63 stop:353 length:291 start_codon:yes stop_codon:yes gene_type:complete
MKKQHTQIQTKPVRTPPSLSEADKQYLTIKRTNQNNAYELTGLFLGLLRLHESKGSRVTRVAFNQAHRYVFPVDEKNENNDKYKSIEEAKINSMGE